MGQLTIDTADDVKVLRAARAFLDGLLGDSVDPDDTNDEPPRPEGDPSANGSVAEDMVRRLWSRTGAKTHKYLTECARLAEAGQFDLEALGQATGDGYDAARKWRYGLGRSLKKIASEMPSAPPLFNGHWDGTKQVYTMRPEVAASILGQQD
jgi:hypothetical protein